MIWRGYRYLCSNEPGSMAAVSSESWHRVPPTINTILICDWNCNILHFSISSAINTLHRRMQARNTYLKFKWPHWQEMLDKSDVSYMLVVPVCEDYWDWDQSIGVLPRRVTATYLTIVTQSCGPVATISRHPQFSHRYTVSYTVFRKAPFTALSHFQNIWKH